MKTVQVPDNWCEECEGRGTVALHGIAITASEFDEWDGDEIEAYSNGSYDTTCEACEGSGKVDPEAAESYQEDRAMMRAEAPHMFV